MNYNFATHNEHLFWGGGGEVRTKLPSIFSIYKNKYGPKDQNFFRITSRIQAE